MVKEIDGKFNQFQVAFTESDAISVISFGISLHYSALYDIEGGAGQSCDKMEGVEKREQQFFVAKSRLKLL